MGSKVTDSLSAELEGASPFRMLSLAFFAPDVPASGLRRVVVQLVKQLTSSPCPLARNKMLALV